MYSRTVVLQAFRDPQISAKELDVVREFTAFADARIEGLFGLRPPRSMRLQDIASTIRQRHECRFARPRSKGATALISPALSQALEVPMPHVSCPAAVVPQIVGRHGAERAYGRERPHLGAAEAIVVAVHANVLAVRATRQVEILREHVPAITRPSSRGSERSRSRLSFARGSISSTPLPSGRPKLRRHVLVHTLGGDELPVDVCQLPAGFAQEEPTRQDVIRCAQIQEYE